MFSHTKPAWHISAEIKLKRLEAEASQARAFADSVHDELTALSQQRARLQQRRQFLVDAPVVRGPANDPGAGSRQIAEQLATVDAELEALAPAIDDCNTRRAAAQAVASVKVSLYGRAKRAMHATAGGLPHPEVGV